MFCAVLLISTLFVLGSCFRTLAVRFICTDLFIPYQIMNRIQMYKRFKRTLFIWTKHNMEIFGVIPFYQATKRDLNNSETMKNVLKRITPKIRLCFVLISSVLLNLLLCLDLVLQRQKSF